MATKKESTAKSKADDSVDKEATNAATEEVKSSAAISPAKKASDDGFFKRSSILMALIVAIPAGAIIAYLVVPDELT